MPLQLTYGEKKMLERASREGFSAAETLAETLTIEVLRESKRRLASAGSAVEYLIQAHQNDGYGSQGTDR